MSSSNREGPAGQNLSKANSALSANPSQSNSNNNNNNNKKLDFIIEDQEMNEHMKAMWAGQSNVLVAVRTRPLMKHDIIKRSCVRVLDSKVVVILDPATGDKQDILRANRSREKQYAFDFVFDSSASQESVYHNTTQFLIHGVLDGFNATVFAYGQTGSGKTHTMIGTQTDPGIMVRVMEDLFKHSVLQGKQQGVQFKVTVSFLEVYNENIRDLLSEVEEYLDLREDPIKGPVVASITEIEATSGNEIMQLLHQGNAKRSQAATAANEVSSRSHAVLQVVVESRDRAPGTVANIKVGKLSLVDLAGSERAANTKNVGARLVEGANINRSLLALGNCINALGEKGNKGNFVPYRDSKLTRLLKDSLGGNCRTVMIANISSAESSFEETLNTLKYANRAKNIKTNVQRNVLNVNYHISEYVELINNLRSEIQVLKNQIGGVPAIDRVSTSHFPRESLGIAAQKEVRIMTPNQVGGALHPGGAFASMLPMNSPAFNNAPSTPFQALRESLRSGTAAGEGRELVNNMRQRIVDNFQERMQLRRSLIELEDQNVQNGIEVSKRQLIIVQWSEKHGNFLKKNSETLTKSDFSAYIMSNGSPEIVEAWQETEQLRKAIIKNNGMKKNIAKRLRHNEKDAEKFRDEMGENVTGEDRRELMALQYQVGRLELENMELEQHRIVHESILKGKDLVIQKLKLQLAVRDRLIGRQQIVLKEHNLDSKVGYDQLALMEETLMGDPELISTMAPPSPPRNVSQILTEGQPYSLDEKLAAQKQVLVPKLKIQESDKNANSDEDDDEYDMSFTEREIALTSRDRDIIEQGDWSEIQSELSDHSFSFGGNYDREGAGAMAGGGAGAGNRAHRKDRDRGAAQHYHQQQQVTPLAEQKKGSVQKVNGPRGGRMYRASVGNGSEEKRSDDAYGARAGAGGNRYAQMKGGNSDDFSDNDSDNNQAMAGKYRHYSSPRPVKEDKGRGSGRDSSDRLEPITSSGQQASEEGVLSGRRYDKSDISPRDGYAVIYPSLNSNKASNNYHGGRKASSDVNEEKGRRMEKVTSRNSKGNLEEVNNAADLLFNDFQDNMGIGPVGGAAAANPAGLNDLVVKSKPLPGKQLSKLKSKPISGSNLPTDITPVGPSAVPESGVGVGGDLNIMGSGIEGTGVPAVNRPANNRLKLNARPGNKQRSIGPSPSASDVTELTPSVAGEIGSQIDSALNYRMKSLPTLSKQSGNSGPNSARGDNLINR